MNRFKVVTDIVYNNNTKTDITIAHISDIHFNTNTKIKKLKRLKEELYKMNPDYIMLTGDTIDDPQIVNNTEKIKELVVFMKDISEEYKILISLGNHDILTIKDHQFFNKINDLDNIYVLDNDTYEDDKIYVTGFTLPHSYYYNITHHESKEILLELLDENKELLNNLPNNKPKVSLIHSPIKLTDEEVIEELKQFDIILSGHTHNGMVPDILKMLFPKNVGIIAPRKQLFPAIAKGKVEINKGNKQITIIINGAITKLSFASGKVLRNLDCLYNSNINKVIIRKKRRF